MDAITVVDLQSIDMSLIEPRTYKKGFRDYAIEVAEFLWYGAIMIAAIGIYLGVCAMIVIWSSLTALELLVIHFPR